MLQWLDLQHTHTESIIGLSELKEKKIKRGGGERRRRKEEEEET